MLTFSLRCHTLECILRLEKNFDTRNYHLIYHFNSVNMSFSDCLVISLEVIRHFILYGTLLIAIEFKLMACVIAISQF